MMFLCTIAVLYVIYSVFYINIISRVQEGKEVRV